MNSCFSDQELRLEEGPKNGHKVVVKVQAIMVHCNNKITGFRWKRSCFTGRYFCLNSKCQKYTITFPPSRNILVACQETGSLPEQVKQKENLSDHNIHLKNLS